MNIQRHRLSNLLCRLGALSALALAVASGDLARADDIDTYSNPPGAGGVPNVLFILDNTANWSGTLAKSSRCDEPKARVDVKREDGTKMGAEKCALYKLLSAMSVAELGQYNFGFMLFNESPNSSAYPRQAFIQVKTQADKDAMLKMISDFDIQNDRGDSAASAEAFYEAWLWFTGSKVRLGNKTLPKNDKRAFVDLDARTTYKSPGIGCAKNHIIYLANGFVQDNNTTTEQLLKSINPSAKRIAIPIAEGVGTNDANNWSDEFAAFFSRGADLSAEFEGQQTIQVHTIAVTGSKSDGNFPNYIRWIAQMGGGLYQQASDTDTIIAGIKDALNQIRASNAVFSSAALPVSANTQGAYLNQVFIGMFRPDANALQRWVGNLKQYQFNYDPILDTLELADSQKNAAVSPVTGFIRSSAVSFWTQPSSYWINAEIASTGKITRSDSPDGELVEKGGVAQWLRTTYPTLSARDKRPVYTCVDNCSNVDFVAQEAAGKKDWLFSTENSKLRNELDNYANDENRLIQWVRGEENIETGTVADVNAAKDQLTRPPKADTTLDPPIAQDNTVRPSIHGDVLHSRPVALNYKDLSTVVVFYGANDGKLRAINGNQTGDGAGSELWAFVAPEHFPTLNRLRENDPEVKYPSTSPTNLTAKKRDYFFDGPIGAYQNTANGEVLIFATMRRGGRAVYAFNVSDPAKPVLMWRVNNLSTNYSTIGQTWSTPRVARVKRTDGETDPYLIMGGGYDDEAEDGVTAGSTTKGRGVYVMNMRTGERVAHLLTDHSVPSDVSLVDTDGDGYVDRGYVVDVRANVYRLDIEDKDGKARTPALWVLTKIANFGYDTTNPRRVFFAPDVVLTKTFTALMLGTGDREKPLTTLTNDRFYIIKDRKVTKGEPTSVTILNDNSPKMVAISDTAYQSDPDGCYLALATDGEKVINQPITFGGITYFSTSKPSTSAQTCTTTKSRAYQIPLLCKSASYVELVGDGLPPSPVVGYVEVAAGKVVPFVIGGPNTKKSSIEVNRAQISIPGNRKRSYWFMNNRDR